jgi:hypothetical protein
MGDDRQPPRGEVIGRGEGAGVDRVDVRRVEGSGGDGVRPPVAVMVHRPGRSWWPLALMAMVLGITAAVTAVILYPMWAAKDLTQRGGAAAIEVVSAAVEKAALAMRPEIIRHETITIISEQAQRRAKLVVMEQPITVQFEKADEYRLLWDYLYLGQNTVMLRIEGNRVQWVVDLARFTESDVEVDESARTVTLRFARPRLDMDMVVVQTDPGRIQVQTGRGWARWPGSTNQLAEEAKRQIRPRVITGANTEENRQLAEEAAHRALRTVFEPLARRWSEEGYDLRIVLTSTPPQG